MRMAGRFMAQADQLSAIPTIAQFFALATSKNYQLTAPNPARAALRIAFAPIGEPQADGLLGRVRPSDVTVDGGSAGHAAHHATGLAARV